MPRKIGSKRISASQKAFDFCISRGTVFQVGKRKTRTLSKSLTKSHFNLTVRKAITNDLNIPTLVQVKGKEVKIHYDSEVSCEVQNILIQRLREGVSLEPGLRNCVTQLKQAEQLYFLLSVSQSIRDP